MISSACSPLQCVIFLSITNTLRQTSECLACCQLFLTSGSCTMDVCRYRHVSEKEYEDDVYYTLLQMVYESCRKFNPDLPPPNRNIPPPRDPGDLPPPPPIHRKMDGGPAGGFGGPPPGPPPSHNFRDYDHVEGGDLRANLNRREFEWDRPPFGFPPKPHDPSMQVDQLTRENSELRRMMAEESARYKVQ